MRARTPIRRSTRRGTRGLFGRNGTPPRIRRARRGPAGYSIHPLPSRANAAALPPRRCPRSPHPAGSWPTPARRPIGVVAGPATGVGASNRVRFDFGTGRGRAPQSGRYQSSRSVPHPLATESEGGPRRASSLQGHGLLLRLERRLERVPREARALHADRELADAGEDRELAEGRVDRIPRTARDHLTKSLEQTGRLGLRLALHRVRHQGSRRLRDRAALADERDVRDVPVVEAQGDGHPIPAERGVPAGCRAGARDLAGVAGALVVVQNRVLVELSEVGRQKASRRAMDLDPLVTDSLIIRSRRVPLPSGAARESTDRV